MIKPGRAAAAAAATAATAAAVAAPAPADAATAAAAATTAAAVPRASEDEELVNARHHSNVDIYHVLSGNLITEHAGRIRGAGSGTQRKPTASCHSFLVALR